MQALHEAEPIVYYYHIGYHIHVYTFYVGVENVYYRSMQACRLCMRQSPSYTATISAILYMLT